MRVVSVIIVSVVITVCCCQDTEYIDCSNTKYGCCQDGITPSDGSKGLNCPRSRHLIGGCAGTQFGCCKDGSYAIDLEKSNCKESQNVNVVKRAEFVGQTNNQNNTDSNPSQMKSNFILISIGSTLFSLVLTSVMILLVIAVVIIVCRSVRQKQARKLRLILECDDTGVEMGSPLIVEEFGVRV